MLLAVIPADQANISQVLKIHQRWYFSWFLFRRIRHFYTDGGASILCFLALNIFLTNLKKEYNRKVCHFLLSLSAVVYLVLCRMPLNRVEIFFFSKSRKLTAWETGFNCMKFMYPCVSALSRFVYDIFGRKIQWIRGKKQPKCISSCVSFKKSFLWGRNVTVEVTVIAIKEYGENYIKCRRARAVRFGCLRAFA